MHEINIDNACLCEIWLTDSTLDCMIAPDNYNTIRKDRSDRKGGGVCIIGKNNSSLVFKGVALPSRYHSLEVVAVDILFGNNNGTRLIVVYYPPDQLSNLGTCQLLILVFMFLSNTHLSICIVGDSNLPLMDWVNHSSPNNDVYIEFLSYFINNSLVQLVNFPTRDDNLLDIILSDSSHQISHISSSAPVDLAII